MAVDFMTLFREASAAPEKQQELNRRFWEAAATAGLKLRRRGESAKQSGRRLLIGLATYSSRDIQLAEEIANSPARASDINVEFFDVLEARNGADIASYVPGMESATQTPIVGLWNDERLIQTAQGYAATELARTLLFG